MDRNNFAILIAILSIIITYPLGNNFLMSLGLAMFFFYLVKFIGSLGNQVPVLELLILLALGQWILGPAIDYATEATHYKYFMYINKDEYFSIVTPPILLFVVPVLFFQKKLSFDELAPKIKFLANRNKNLPWLLLIIGIVSSVVAPFLPAALSFVFFITAQFKFIGLIYLFFSDTRYNNTLIYVVFGFTIISSVQSGLFHDLILWSALFLTFLAYYYKWSLRKILIILFIGFILGAVTQSIKSQYREILAEEPELASVQTFGALAYNQLIEGNMFNSGESINELNVRLNQGWIISAIIYNIPKFEPYADGETIEEGLSASFLPRFLSPDKKTAGGQDNFRRFTGLLLRNDTSMGASILGEAYANYGPRGAMLFMFLWGIFLVLIVNTAIRLTTYYPSVILWLPLLFLQALKAETEFVVVLNHLVKSAIVIFGFFYFTTSTLKWKL